MTLLDLQKTVRKKVKVDVGEVDAAVVMAILHKILRCQLIIHECKNLPRSSLPPVGFTSLS